MTAFLIRRLLGMIPTFFIISFIVFVVIQLPPSNWVTRAVEGVAVDSRHFNSESYQAMVYELQRRYNLDRPFLSSTPVGSPASCAATWANRSTTRGWRWSTC